MGVVVAPLTGDYSNLMSSGGQCHGEIGQVLCCRYYIRIKALIQEEYLQLLVMAGF